VDATRHLIGLLEIFLNPQITRVLQYPLVIHRSSLNAISVLGELHSRVKLRARLRREADPVIGVLERVVLDGQDQLDRIEQTRKRILRHLVVHEISALAY